jgi:flagellar protein FliO/FliZ
MWTKFIPALTALTLAAQAYGNTPKAPQSPLPNVDGLSSAAAVASPSEVNLPEQAALSSAAIEKNLPEQTIKDQIASQKATSQKLAAQKSQAQKIVRQKSAAQAAAQKISAQKEPLEKKQAIKNPELGLVTTEVEGDMTIVTARLNTSPDWKDINIEEHGTFLQIKMPGTHVAASGEFIDGNGPFLKKMATFQVGDTDGALRLFTNQDASKAKLATTAELLGDRLVITIDHKKLEQLIAPPQRSTSESPSASEIIAKTTSEKGLTAPSDLIASPGKNSNEAAAKSNPVQELYGQLTKVAGFCAIMFLLFLGVQSVRAKRRRLASAKGGFDSIEPATMKVLSTINIGQKQRLTLVQVGSQQILLGVGPESINMLTAIESKPKISNFASQLQMANPNAEIRLKAPDEVPATKAQRRTLPMSAGSTSTGAKSHNTTSNSINVAIDDDGPRSVSIKPAKKDEDITRMLRDRLRNLPPG